MVLCHDVLKSKCILKFALPFSAHMFKVSSMVPESFFKWSLRRCAISFTFIDGFIRDICFIHNIECKLFIVKKTFICNFALASKTFLVGTQNLFFVWQYNRFHFSNTKITYFNRFGKWGCKSFTNVLSTFIFTLMEKVGLSYITSHLLFRFYPALVLVFD